MTTLDYIVLALYFATMAGIGLWAMRKVKKQEDYFLGGRTFGKLLQTFAAFGAGTGAADPVNTAKTTFTSGLSGMWSVMYWLFVTPLYWISGVWYRRMRHLTLGDWFVERFESKSLGAAYTVFGLLFYMVYTAIMFTAIGKFTAVMLGNATVSVGGSSFGIEYLLVPLIALLVIVYAALGGLTAAYWTDLIQGLAIILLSILLIPFGLNALVEKFGDPTTMGALDGFKIIHQQLPASQFSVVGSGSASEFPLYRIIAIVIINMIGIAVMPHFIATGGGSAKSEWNARVGLVTGNLLKRFCTVGWALTALIALALYAEEPTLVADPDKTWGFASKELLGPGLAGLMLACLLAALMSSADCYMLVCSALVVRNIYAPFVNPDASERQYIMIGRWTGGIVIIGAVIISATMMDVFKQLELSWIVPTIFAAPFWVALFWRRATVTAAWGTVAFATLVFFIIPLIAPVALPGLKTSPRFTKVTEVSTFESTRKASPSDLRKRATEIALWEGPEDKKPAALQLGDEIPVIQKTGGKAIYWSKGVTDGVGQGNFKIDYLLFDLAGVDLTKKSNAMLDTYSLLPKIVTPFLVMILLSLVTKRNSPEALDRYYVKMKTPVDPDPKLDLAEMEASYADPRRFDGKKLFKHPDLEMQRPTTADVVGFIITLALCFGVIGLVIWMAGIGA